MASDTRIYTNHSLVSPSTVVYSPQASTGNAVTSTDTNSIMQQVFLQQTELFKQQTQFMEAIYQRLDRIENRLSGIENRQNPMERLVSLTTDLPKSPAAAPTAAAASAVNNDIPITLTPPTPAAAASSASAASPIPRLQSSILKRPHDGQPLQTQVTKKIALTVGTETIGDLSFVDLHLVHLRSADIYEKYRAETIPSTEVQIIRDKNIRIFDENGELLLVYINNVDLKRYIPLFKQFYTVCSQSFNASTTRGDAAGKFDASTHKKKPEDFVVSSSGLKAKAVGGNYSVGNRHPSMSFGCLAHTRAGNLKCRYVSKNYLVNNDDMRSLLKTIAAVYAKHAPRQFDLQVNALEKHKLAAEKEGYAHVQITDTPFTTITVNVSKDGKPTTYFHKDSNDLKQAFVSLFVDGENYSGGETVFPELIDPETKKPLAFDVRPGTLLLFKGGELLHGNTPVKLGPDGRRVSYVAYVQQTLIECTKCSSKDADSIEKDADR